MTIPIALGEIKENCQSGETEMFTVYQHNNSHIAQSGYYNFSVCFPSEINIVLRKGNCSINEICILSQYQLNNSHVGQCNYFNFSLCSDNIKTVSFTENSCNDEAIVSFYQLNNSHVGQVGYYNYTLCLKEKPEVKIIKGTAGAIEQIKGILKTSRFLLLFCFLGLIIGLIAIKRYKENKRIMNEINLKLSREIK